MPKMFAGILAGRERANELAETALAERSMLNTRNKESFKERERADRIYANARFKGESAGSTEA